MVAITGRSALPNAKRIVVKVGSALLVDEDKNTINKAWLAGIARDISQLKAAGKDVVVVSSGAIALGSRLLKIHNKVLSLQEKQAAAATGQVTLAHAWMEALGAYKVQAAQILLSPDDTETRRKHLNARATMAALLDLGAVPVVNENDTVATAEIRFGDNDRLAARVAAMIGADLLILLSDVDGLYTGNPNQNNDAVHLPQIDHITNDIMAMAGAPNAQYASGGMVTKLEAGRISTAAGCHMIIANGTIFNPIKAIENGAQSTWFQANSTPHGARKAWIASAINPSGSIFIDKGAASAIVNGRSLLPAGILEVSGDFERGDLVKILNQNKNEIARGLVAYSAKDTLRIKGRRSMEIEDILGYQGRDELIHRDDLVLV